MTRIPRFLQFAAAAIISLSACLQAAASVLPEPLVTERLGRDRGFPSETITAIHRDQAGFLWIGSREGLAVYDGYEVRVFQYSVSDPYSISDDAVRALYEDREGRIWIALDAGGLQRMDTATWQLETFSHDPDDTRTLSNESVYAMAEDDNGGLWVATQIGIDRLNLDTGVFDRHLVSDPDDPTSLPNPWTYDLHRDGKGRIWGGTVGGGVIRIDPDSLKVIRVPFSETTEFTTRSELAFTIAENRDGEIWFGVEDGIYRYDEESENLVRAPVPGIPLGADSVIVTSISFDNNGTLWATTWNNGLLGYHVPTGETRWYHQDPDRDDGLNTDRLSCATVDRSGDVWVGSWGGGIHRFSSRAGVFSRTIQAKEGGDGLPYKEVTSVLEDSRGRIYTGTWGEGLAWAGPGSRRFSAIRPVLDNPTEMAVPLSILEESDGVVWIGTMAGLFQVGVDNKLRASYIVNTQRPHGIGPGYINALARDRRNRIWIGSGGDGLHRLEPDGTFTSFRHDPEDPHSLSADHVTSLVLGPDNMLWVGTRSGGLNRFDPETEQFLRFLPDPDDPMSLGHHTVTAILAGSSGTVWAGTAGGGLSRIKPDPTGGWEVTRITQEDGLVNNSVVSIQEDDDGSLWIGTRGGLSRYDPESGRFHNYGTGDGLPSPEFKPNSSARGRTELHFGTLGGMLSITRGSEFRPPPPATTLITAIRTLDGPLPGPLPPWETETIEADFGTMLSFEFGVMDLRPPHRFAYHLEGESESWIDLGNRREVTFAGLQPGTYTLSVRGLNSRGVWSETATPLSINIMPPFWMTWWFRSLMVILAGVVAWTWASLKMRALRRRNRELEELHDQREKALRQARDSEEALQEAYARLRRLTRRLENAKEEERQWIARELHDEMGQALSAIKLNLKALGRQSESPGALERIGDAIVLVDGIIGNVRALSLDLRPPLLDELGLVVALRGYAEGQATRSGIAIAVETNDEIGRIPAEIAITAFRLVQESINNAVRHAAPERVTVSVRRDPRRLTISIRDDGQGFDLEAALERAATGHHLGLLGMRERVEVLGGQFQVETEPGSGTAIHSWMPLDEAAATG